MGRIIVLDPLLPPGYLMRSILAATCIIPVSFVNKERPTWLHVSYTISTGEHVCVHRLGCTEYEGVHRMFAFLPYLLSFIGLAPHCLPRCSVRTFNYEVN